MKNIDKKKFLKEIIPYIIIIIFVLLFRTFIATPVLVDGDSMNTTLFHDEVMILNKINYVFNDVKRFDIVVIDINGERLIKRVVGLPGEVIEYKDSKLLINGKEIKELFKNQETNNFHINEFEIDKIPSDCYFVMGDNRNSSIDSRIFGCVDKKNIKGTANLVLFPFNRLGIKK